MACITLVDSKLESHLQQSKTASEFICDLIYFWTVVAQIMFLSDVEAIRVVLLKSYGL